VAASCAGGRRERVGKREERLIRALMDGATLEAAAKGSGLSRESATRFLESVARFAAAVGAGMEFGLEAESTGASSVPELVLHTDGASLGNPGPSGAGGTIETPSGELVEEFHEYLGKTTNNVAEYEAVRIGLTKAAAYGARRVRVRLDSELVANQLRGIYKVKDSKLLNEYLKVEQILSGFDHVSFEPIPREENRKADRLAQTGARRGDS